MNYSTAIFLISDDVRCLTCIYEADEPGKTAAKRHQFKTFAPDVAVDDLVVVPTETRHGMTVVKVVEADVEPNLGSEAEIKWIVDKVDTSNFARLQEQEGEAIEAIKKAEKRKQRDELRKALIADAEDELKSLPIYEAGKET